MLTDTPVAPSARGYTLNIDPALVLSPSTLNTVTVGNAFSTQLTAAGGSGEDYFFTSTSLPAGVKLDSDGTLHGTPTTATGSPFHFTVTATDNMAGTVTDAYTLAVNTAPAASPSKCGSGPPWATISASS